MAAGKISLRDMKVPFALAFMQLAIQVLFHQNYGYFRDELYYIACSEHLAWGYVDQPPFSLALLAVNRWLLGDSLHALRFLPTLVISGVVVLAALMARRFGGGRFAQGLAALAVVAAPVLLGQGKFFSMNAFDVLFWVLALYLFIAIISGGSAKLWIYFGLVIGFGLLNKYSIGFLVIGLVAGLLLTSHRRQLASRWFWAGALLAGLIFLPHVLWEIKNGFPSLEFMRNASQLKNAPLTPFQFLGGQFLYVNFFNAPIWLLGLYFFFFHPAGKPFRLLGWTYVVVFIIMTAGGAKVYYLAPIYPVLLAGGAVLIERFIRARAWNWMKPVCASILAVSALIFAPFAIPILPVETFIAYQSALGQTPRAEERSSLGVLPQLYADEFGWEEMVAQVAGVYQKLSAEDQANCVIYVRNYGEAGAIDFFGKKYSLPQALCAHNNYWLWGPGKLSGDIAIIFGGSHDLQENLTDLSSRYRQVELAATTNCRYSMPYENGRQIFLCRGMNTTFQALWSEERFYI